MVKFNILQLFCGLHCMISIYFLARKAQMLLLYSYILDWRTKLALKETVDF